MGHHLIATTRPGAEKQAALELGDALFRRDPHVAPRATRYPGTLLVETRVHSLEAYIIALGTHLSTPLRIVPLLPPPDVVRSGRRLREEGVLPSRVFPRCELRGRRGECREVEARLLGELGLQPAPRSRAEYTLHVEGVDETWGAVLLPRECDVLNSVYSDPRLRRLCLGFVKKVLLSLIQ